MFYVFYTPIQNIMIMERYCLLTDVCCPSPLRPFSCSFCTYSYYPVLCLRQDTLRLYTEAKWWFLPFFSLWCPKDIHSFSGLYLHRMLRQPQESELQLPVVSSAAGKQSLDYLPFVLYLAALKLIWCFFTDGIRLYWIGISCSPLEGLGLFERSLHPLRFWDFTVVLFSRSIMVFQ